MSIIFMFHFICTSLTLWWRLICTFKFLSPAGPDCMQINRWIIIVVLHFSCMLKHLNIMLKCTFQYKGKYTSQTNTKTYISVWCKNIHFKIIWKHTLICCKTHMYMILYMWKLRFYISCKTYFNTVWKLILMGIYINVTIYFNR